MALFRILSRSLLFILSFNLVAVGAADSGLDTEIAELQARMNQLQAQVLTSQKRLEDLRQDAGTVSDKGIRLIVKMRNSLGDDYDFERARFFLNGKKLVGIKHIREEKEIQIYEGFVPAGVHKLKGVVAVKGKNNVFSYFDAFSMRFAEEVAFEARPDAEITVNFDAIKRNNILLPLEKRPKLRASVSESFDNPNMPELVLSDASRSPSEKFGQNAGLTIAAKNNLGKDFKLVTSRIYLDGKLINPDDKIQSFLGSEKLFSGSVQPGEHVMDVHLVYNGRSPLFNQFSGYHFLLKYSQKVTLKPGQTQSFDLESQYPQEKGI